MTDYKKEVFNHLVSVKDTVDVAVQTEIFRTNHVVKVSKEGMKNKRRKMCKNCYKKNNELHGCKYAMNKTIKNIYKLYVNNENK